MYTAKYSNLIRLESFLKHHICWKGTSNTEATVPKAPEFLFLKHLN